MISGKDNVCMQRNYILNLLQLVFVYVLVCVNLTGRSYEHPHQDNSSRKGLPLVCVSVCISNASAWAYAAVGNC
jgi:hypothetical protein